MHIEVAPKDPCPKRTMMWMARVRPHASQARLILAISAASNIVRLAALPVTKPPCTGQRELQRSTYWPQ